MAKKITSEEYKKLVSAKTFAEIVSIGVEKVNYFHNHKKALFNIKNINVVTDLLESGLVDINSKDAYKRNLLYAYKNNFKYTKYLISKGIDINNSDFQGKTILRYITDPKIFKLYLSSGIDVNILDANNRSIVWDYLRATKTSLVFLDMLLDNSQIVNFAQPDIYDKNCFHMLNSAIVLNKIVEYCKKNNTYYNLNAMDSYNKYPLHNAFKNRLLLLSYIKHGANLAIKDSGGKNILHYCSNLKTLKYLISLGILPDETSNNGNNILMNELTKYVYEEDKIKFLISVTNKLDHKNNAGQNFMDLALTPNRPRMGYIDGLNKGIVSRVLPIYEQQLLNLDILAKDCKPTMVKKSTKI